MKITIGYSVAAFALGAGLVLGGLVTQTTGGRVPVRVVEAAGPPGHVSFDEGFSPMIQNVLPAVVNIASSRTVQSGGMLSDPFR